MFTPYGAPIKPSPLRFMSNRFSPVSTSKQQSTFRSNATLPFKTNLIEQISVNLVDVDQKMIISGISLVPQFCVFLVLALVIYLSKRSTITKNAGLDVVLWLGLFGLTFGVNLGFMYIDWPGIEKPHCSTTITE